jgi:hypothetical protein
MKCNSENEVHKAGTQRAESLRIVTEGKVRGQVAQSQPKGTQSLSDMLVSVAWTLQYSV